jgi:hypothetical protein
MTRKQRLVECRYCGEEGLVWLKAPSGRWYLSRPVEGGTSPPSAAHLCLHAESDSALSEQVSSRRNTVSESRRPVDTELHRRISERLNKSSIFPGE